MYHVLRREPTDPDQIVWTLSRHQGQFSWVHVKDEHVPSECLLTIGHINLAMDELPELKRPNQTIRVVEYKLVLVAEHLTNL